MKNLILIILFLIGIKAVAQYNIPVEQMINYTRTQTQNNHYFKDINGVLDKFVGNWKYQTTTDLVEITIFKEYAYNTGGNYLKDVIYIEFRYTQNGIVRLDTFGDTRSYHISGLRFRTPSDTNKYRLLYLEPGQRRIDNYQYVDIEFIPGVNGGQPHLNWVLFSDPTSVNPTLPIMPFNMVFVKVP